MSRRYLTQLSETLSLALSQCQEQNEVFNEQAQIIEKLQAENERLRAEILETRLQLNIPESDQEKRIQQLFQQNTAKQVEINALKRLLKSYEHKLRRDAPTLSSSSPSSRHDQSRLDSSERKRKLSDVNEHATEKLRSSDEAHRSERTGSQEQSVQLAQCNENSPGVRKREEFRDDQLSDELSSHQTGAEVDGTFPGKNQHREAGKLEGLLSKRGPEKSALPKPLNVIAPVSFPLSRIGPQMGPQKSTPRTIQLQGSHNSSKSSMDLKNGRTSSEAIWDATESPPGYWAFDMPQTQEEEENGRKHPEVIPNQL